MVIEVPASHQVAAEQTFYLWRRRESSLTRLQVPARRCRDSITGVVDDARPVIEDSPLWKGNADRRTTIDDVFDWIGGP